MDKSGHAKKTSKDTHFLESTERGTSQHIEKKRVSEVHSLPGGHGGRDKSGQKGR